MTNKEMIRAAFERDTTDERIIKEWGDTFTPRDIYFTIKGMFKTTIPIEEITAELKTYDDIDFLFKRKRGQ